VFVSDWWGDFVHLSVVTNGSLERNELVDDPVVVVLGVKSGLIQGNFEQDYNFILGISVQTGYGRKSFKVCLIDSIFRSLPRPRMNPTGWNTFLILKPVSRNSLELINKVSGDRDVSTSGVHSFYGEPWHILLPSVESPFDDESTVSFVELRSVYPDNPAQMWSLFPWSHTIVSSHVLPLPSFFSKLSSIHCWSFQKKKSNSVTRVRDSISWNCPFETFFMMCRSTSNLSLWVWIDFFPNCWIFMTVGLTRVTSIFLGILSPLGFSVDFFSSWRSCFPPLSVKGGKGRVERVWF
jgi:hypothetical protein